MIEWKEYKLNDLITKLGDGLHGTPKYDPNGVFYFINGSNLKDGKITINENTKKVGKEEYNKYKKELTDRTIFVSINGTLGNIATYNNESVILGKSACYFNVKEDVSRDFIKYVVTNNTFQHYINEYATGTTIKNVPLKAIREYPIRLPELRTQNLISEILSSLDDKIELNNKINQELESLAQLLFKRWFVDFEFPNENGEPYKSSGGEMVDSEFGEIPKGWKISKIQEVVKQIKPGTNFQPKRTQTGIPFLNVRNINSGFIDTSDSKLISKEDYDAVHKVWQPEELDILISRIGTLGLVAPILAKDLPIAVHYNFILIKPDELSSHFLYFLLKSDVFQFKYKSLAKASVQEYVTIDEVKDIEIFIPDKMTLDILDENLKGLFDVIVGNYETNLYLKSLRDHLLPKLISGELKINDN